MSLRHDLAVIPALGLDLLTAPARVVSHHFNEAVRGGMSPGVARIVAGGTAIGFNAALFTLGTFVFGADDVQSVSLYTGALSLLLGNAFNMALEVDSNYEQFPSLKKAHERAKLADDMSSVQLEEAPLEVAAELAASVDSEEEVIKLGPVENLDRILPVSMASQNDRVKVGIERPKF